MAALQLEMMNVCTLTILIRQSNPFWFSRFMREQKELTNSLQDMEVGLSVTQTLTFKINLIAPALLSSALDSDHNKVTKKCVRVPVTLLQVQMLKRFDGPQHRGQWPLWVATFHEMELQTLP